MKGKVKEMEEAKFYMQAHSKINGRNVWHYMVSTPIGDYHIVEYEQKDSSIKEFVFPHNNQKAEQKYDSLCIEMVKGRK